MTGKYNNWKEWYTSLNPDERIAYKAALSHNCQPMNLMQMMEVANNQFFFSMLHLHKALIYMGYKMYHMPANKCITQKIMSQALQSI